MKNKPEYGGTATQATRRLRRSKKGTQGFDHGGNLNRRSGDGPLTFFELAGGPPPARSDMERKVIIDYMIDGKASWIDVRIPSGAEVYRVTVLEVQETAVQYWDFRGSENKGAD